MNAILSEKGQVTIPKHVRDLLGLRPGTVLNFKVEGGRLLATKTEPTDGLAKWRGKGKIPNGLSVDEYLAVIRGGK